MRLSSLFARAPFSPSDWLIIAVLGGVAVIAAGSLLASFSLYFTEQVPARGGTHYEGVVGVPRFINPILAISDADRDLTALIHAGLLKVSTDGTLAPDLAESYSVSEDKLTYTFILKSATFHDGTPLTAGDVAFTVGLAQSAAIKSPKRPNWEGVAVEAVDDRTVTFTLKSPYAPFLQNMTLGILPRHLWESVSAEEFPFSTLNVQAVGAGPYQIDEVTVSAAGIPEMVSLKAFRNAPTVPYISTMIFSFYPDTDALAVALAATPRLAAHSIAPDGTRDHRLEEAVLGRIFGVFFNQNQNELFADRTVRAALDTALDKQALIDTLVAGYGSPLQGPLPPPSVSESGLVTTTTDRLQSGKDILANAGWKAGDDGILQKTVRKSTTRLSFTLVTGNAPELKRAAEVVAETWRSLGAEVETQFFEAGDLQQEIIRPRKYDALLFGEVVGRDLDLFAFWHSSQRNDPGLNVALYVNSEVDDLLEEARTIEDATLRREKVLEAATIIEDEHAAIFLYAPHFIYLVPDTLSGIQLGSITTPADRFVGVTDWYLARERVWPLFK